MNKRELENYIKYDIEELLAAIYHDFIDDLTCEMGYSYTESLEEWYQFCKKAKEDIKSVYSLTPVKYILAFGGIDYKAFTSEVLVELTNGEWEGITEAKLIDYFNGDIPVIRVLERFENQKL